MSPTDPIPTQGPPRRVTPSSFLLAVATGLLLWILSPFWRPILSAAVLSATMIGAQERIARRLWNRRYIAAGLLTIGVVILILTPLAVLATVAVKEASELIATVRDIYHEAQTEGFETALHRLPDGIERLIKPLTEHLPDNLTSLPEGTTDAGKWVVLQLQGVVTTAASLAFDLAIMLIALFFLLADGSRALGWIIEVSPLGPGRTRELLGEFRAVSRSLVGSGFITGVVQSIFATTGYYLASAPQPLFFGLLTLFASFLPAVGTSLVGLPLAAVLAFSGHPWAALFLGLWVIFVVGLVDNLLRPYLMRGDLHVPSAAVFFCIIGGVSVFGFAGVLVGPLVLALFMTMLRFQARDRRGLLGEPDDASSSL